MFEIVELELRLAAMVIHLPGDDETTTQAIMTDLLTKDPDGKYSGFILSDPKCKAIIAASMTAVKNSLLPTPAVIARWLVARKNNAFGKESEHAEKAVEEFAVAERGTEKPNVRVAQFYASELERIASRRNLYQAAEELKEISVAGIGNPDAVYSQMHARLGEAMPPSTSDALTGDQLDEVWLKEMQFRQILTTNKVPFMTLPPKLGLGDNIKRLKPGDSTIITGPTKSRKTSLALELIEHIGLSGNGLMHCLYFHAETQAMDLQDRLVSSRAGVSMEDLRQGVRNERVDEALAAMKTWKKYTTFVYCAGWTPEQIAATIRRFAAKMQKWHSLLVIVDYVDQDKLNLSHYKTDNVAYQIGRAFSTLRATAEQCSWKGDRPGVEAVYQGFVHVLSFQQENDEGRARGSRAGTMYSQNYIRIASTVLKKATMDVSWVYRQSDPNGPFAGSCTLTKGQDAPFVRFQIIATNDGYPGTTYVAVDKFRFLFPVDSTIGEDLEEKELKKTPTTQYAY